MKKKITFITDSKIKYYQGEYYSNSLSNFVWKRYLFDNSQLTVFSRIIELKEYPKNLLKSSFNDVKFDGCYTDSISSLASSSLRKKIKMLAIQSDLVIIRFPSISGFIAEKICRKYQIKYVIELVGDINTSLKSINKMFFLLSPFATLYTKQVIKRTNNIIYVSKFFLQKKYKNSKNFLYCPDVYLDKPQQKVLNNRIHKIRNYNKDTTYKIGIVGSIDVPYRGHAILLDICQQLIQQNYNIEMHCLGGGKQNTILEKVTNKSILNQIFLDGTKSFGNDVFKWMDDIDILVMPTKAETLGRSIIEAMSRGCPVIGTLETAIPEQIGSDCIFSYKDLNGIKNHIIKMINNNKYMEYCALENFYRSFKYCNEETDMIRKKYLLNILNEF